MSSKIAAPSDGEACARPARPTRSLRAPHRHDFDARAFTRALYAGSQNHAGPASLLSCASRLSGLCVSPKSSARLDDSLATENTLRRNTPSAPARQIRRDFVRTVISRSRNLCFSDKLAADFAIIPLSREAHAATRGHSPENESNLRRAFDLLHYCNAVVQRNLRNFKQDDVLAEVCHLARLYTFLVGLLRASGKT